MVLMEGRLFHLTHSCIINAVSHTDIETLLFIIPYWSLPMKYWVILLFCAQICCYIIFLSGTNQYFVHTKYELTLLWFTGISRWKQKLMDQICRKHSTKVSLWNERDNIQLFKDFFFFLNKWSSHAFIRDQVRFLNLHKATMLQGQDDWGLVTQNCEKNPRK